MLILTRKPGESVMIEESVRITVLEVRGSQVKLGIQAPLDVRVNREEVLERQRAEAGLPPIPDLPLPPAREAAHGGRGRGPEERRPAANGRNDVSRQSGRSGREVPARGPEAPSRGGRSDRDSRFERVDRSARATRPDRSGRREGDARPSSDPLPRPRNGGSPERDPGRPRQEDRFDLRGPARPREETPSRADPDDMGAPVVRRYRSPNGPRPHRAGRLAERLGSQPPPAERGTEPDQGSLAPEVPPLAEDAAPDAPRRARRAGGSEAA